jgi:putative tryptophan/tyrosine transport system substrate-binding protein
MRRRKFIAGLGGVAAWPLVARAQQAAMPAIGFLDSARPRPNSGVVVSFRQGLAEVGYVEGGNVTVEYRWASGQITRLPSLAAELVGLQVAVIVAAGNTRASLVAMAATSAIPIVFAYAGDPVEDGLVASLNRPGGNVTGVSYLNTELGGKRLSLLRDLVPQATAVGFLSYGSRSHTYQEQRSGIIAAARELRRELIILEIRGDQEYEAAFTTLIERQAGGLVVGAFSFRNRDKILALVARYKIPTIYPDRGYVVAGGLMSYNARLNDVYRQVGIYTGQILKGAKPANLPVVLPTKFEFVINLKTAKALGLTVPETLLATADEVIQ